MENLDIPKKRTMIGLFKTDITRTRIVLTQILIHRITIQHQVLNLMETVLYIFLHSDNYVPQRKVEIYITLLVCIKWVQIWLE